MTLSQTILDAARDEVAIRIKNDKIDFPIRDYKTFYKWCKGTKNEELLYPVEQEAALLAMDKQVEFFRHIFFIGWRVVDNIDGEPIYEQGEQGPQQTELELFNLWKEEKG